MGIMETAYYECSDEGYSHTCLEAMANYALQKDTLYMVQRNGKDGAEPPVMILRNGSRTYFLTARSKTLNWSKTYRNLRLSGFGILDTDSKHALVMYKGRHGLESNAEECITGRILFQDYIGFPYENEFHWELQDCEGKSRDAFLQRHIKQFNAIDSLYDEHCKWSDAIDRYSAAITG